MNQLKLVNTGSGSISIDKKVIGDMEVNSVNLRDVWRFVESKQEFSNWAKNRLNRATEGVDFTSFDKVIKRETGSTRIKDYIVSVDYAKMICMLENNSKGDELRKYFIDCEKKLLSQRKVPQTYAEALLEAGRSALENERLEAEKQKALAQAEYQDKALTTSQIRNGLRTKENKKLKAKIRGYQNNFASILQYTVREGIDTRGVSTNTIVTKLRKECSEDQKIKQTIEGDKFPSWCFELDYLDARKEDIEVMIELLKRKKEIGFYLD